jgi:hypothetical protein
MDPLARHSPEGHYFVALREDIKRRQLEDLRCIIQREGGRVGSLLTKDQLQGFHATLSPQTLIQVKNHDAVSYVDTEHPAIVQERLDELMARREQQRSAPEDMQFLWK